MKKIIVFATTASLVLGSTGLTAFGSTFADINTVPWPGAATFIDQAASLGLMSGYTENGKKYCKPKNPVTYCEATQLMYSIMKTYTKQDVTQATITKWKPIMDAYKIPSWAYNAVAYGLENGILITNDLSKFMSGTTQKNASREDVGVIFGKALGKVYTVDTSAKLSYKDAASISSSAVPYLDLLYDKKIMVGDDYNNFNPKVNINRAEMAVLSVKTYNTLTSSGTQTKPETPSSGTVNGTVVSTSLLSNGELFLSMRTSTGGGLNLFVPTSVKPTYDGDTISVADIGKDDTLTVTYSGDQVKSLTVTKSANGIGESESFDEIKQITSSKITIKKGSKEETYYLADSVSVTIDGKSSSMKTLMNDVDDNTVYAGSLRLDKDEYVTSITVSETNNNPRTGTLTDLDSDELTIKVGSKSYDYELADDDIDVSGGGSSMTFSKLKRDYEDNNYNVTLTLNSSNKVTKITINFFEDEENGVLTFINSNRLTIEASGKDYDYNLDDDVEVTIDGKSSSLSKLKENYKDVSYRVSLTLDRDDYVTEIEATKAEESVSEGVLTYMGSSYLKIEDKDEKEYRYDVLEDTDDIDVTIDGKSSSYAKLKDNYKDSTYEVELSFKGNEVSKIKATNKDATKGELRDLDLDDETITIRVDSSNKEYDLDDDVDVTIDGSSSSLSKLDREFNDYGYTFEVELTLNSKGDVTKIKATDADSSKSVKGDLEDMNLSWIRVDGDKYYYADDSDDVDVTIDGKSKSLDTLYDRFHEDEDEFRVTLTLDKNKEVEKVVATTK